MVPVDEKNLEKVNGHLKTSFRASRLSCLSWNMLGEWEEGRFHRMEEIWRSGRCAPRLEEMRAHTELRWNMSLCVAGWQSLESEDTD